MSCGGPRTTLLGLRMNWHWVSGGRHWSSSRTSGQSVGVIGSLPTPPALPLPSRMWLILMLKGNSWPASKGQRSEVRGGSGTSTVCIRHVAKKKNVKSGKKGEKLARNPKYWGEFSRIQHGVRNKRLGWRNVEEKAQRGKMIFSETLPDVQVFILVQKRCPAVACYSFNKAMSLKYLFGW